MSKIFFATVDVAHQRFTEDHKSNVTFEITLKKNGDEHNLNQDNLDRQEVEDITGQDRVDHLSLVIHHKGLRSHLQTSPATLVNDSFDPVSYNPIVDEIAMNHLEGNHEIGDERNDLKVIDILSNATLVNGKLRVTVNGLCFGNEYDVYVAAIADTNAPNGPGAAFVLKKSSTHSFELTIRTPSDLGGPARYEATSNVDLGEAVTLTDGESGKKFLWTNEGNKFQFNLEYESTKPSDTSADPAADSIEWYNGDRSIHETGHMDDGNWVDGHLYTLHMDTGATSMDIYTYGVTDPVSEDDIQWTITYQDPQLAEGGQHTTLKGTIDTSVAGKTKLVVKLGSNGLPLYSPWGTCELVSYTINKDFDSIIENDELVAELLESVYQPAMAHSFKAYTTDEWKDSIQEAIGKHWEERADGELKTAANAAANGSFNAGNALQTYVNTLYNKMALETGLTAIKFLKDSLPKYLLQHSFVHRRPKSEISVGISTILTDAERAFDGGSEISEDSEKYTNAANRAVLEIDPFWTNAPAYEKAFIDSVSVNLVSSNTILYPKLELANRTANTNGATTEDVVAYSANRLTVGVDNAHEVFETGSFKIVEGDDNVRHLEGLKGEITDASSTTARKNLLPIDQLVKQRDFDPLDCGLGVENTEVHEFVDERTYVPLEVKFRRVSNVGTDLETHVVSGSGADPDDSRRQNLKRYIAPNVDADFKGIDMDTQEDNSCFMCCARCS